MTYKRRPRFTICFRGVDKLVHMMPYPPSPPIFIMDDTLPLCAAPSSIRPPYLPQTAALTYHELPWQHWRASSHLWCFAHARAVPAAPFSPYLFSSACSSETVSGKPVSSLSWKLSSMGRAALRIAGGGTTTATTCSSRCSSAEQSEWGRGGERGVFLHSRRATVSMNEHGNSARDEGVMNLRHRRMNWNLPGVRGDLNPPARALDTGLSPGDVNGREHCQFTDACDAGHEMRAHFAVKAAVAVRGGGSEDDVRVRGGASTGAAATEVVAEVIAHNQIMLDK